MTQKVTNRNIFIVPALVALGISLWFIYTTNQPVATTDTVNQSSNSLKATLDKALLDEYKARATYQSVIAKFGQVRPFINIVQAENNHIALLQGLYSTYNLTQPAVPTISPPDFSSIADACTVGVQAEIDNAKLYREDLLPQVSNYPDVTNIFTQLMNASQNNHLPAFQRCTNR